MRRGLLFCLFTFIVGLAPVRAQEVKEEAATAPVRVEGRRLFEVTASGTSTATQRAARWPQALPPFKNLSEESGEFSLDYDCLPLDEANARIEEWNAAQG